MNGDFPDTAPVESSPNISQFQPIYGSLSSSSRGGATQISKAYTQAANLFLTRRLSEALSTLTPIVEKPVVEEISENPAPTPIAIASRSSRIKIWSLYLTLLNAIIELGPDEGKTTFGNSVWRDIASKARDGTIWEEVVQVGYNGIEGNVDAEVVINLATLLLSRSSSQSINQQRLESYLSASNSPNSDTADHRESPHGAKDKSNGQRSHMDGTGTPRDLTLRIKILELYLLHVLPRNDEWTYAKEFINMSDDLDEESREALLQALQSLQDEQSNNHEHEASLIRGQDEKLARERQEMARKTMEEARARDERLRKDEQKVIGHKRNESEKDYGIDGPRSISASSKPSSHLTKPVVKPLNNSQSNNSRRPSTTSSKKPNSVGIYKRSVAMMNALRHCISNLTYPLSKNPMLLLRLVLFLMGLVFALSRRDVKDRLVKITGSGWEKIRRTVGMGVKVSYI
ncbi:hypothetical protein MMC07_004254 [Pseudocyphellaria aurata]|nr:hypothetical protein [Pseudocyphellaria aurata]